MIKTINLTLEDTGLRLEREHSSDLIKIRLNDFVTDQEKSKPGHEVFIANSIVEVLPSVKEVKEIIKALQNILPQEDENI